VAPSFNPYAEWLGVHSSDAQPNHYELLRLEPFESNPETILTAANVQMAKVRGVRPGEHVDEWRRLLDELNAAKRCLCEQSEKSQYDALLRKKGVLGPNAAAGSPVGGERAAGGETAAKRTPFMEVSNVGISNPLPPGFGASRAPASSSSVAGDSPSGAKSDRSPDPAAWQPGMNLLPPSPRTNPAAATNQPSDGTTPAQPLAPQQPADSSAAPLTPGMSPSPPAPSPPMPRPKLAFPGETVPATPTSVPVPAAPTMPPPTSAPAPVAGTHPAAPMPPPGFPPGVGGPTQFPRPFPLMPMPGMMPPGAVAPGAHLPGMPQSQPLPQQSFPGPFFPGAPLPGGANAAALPFGLGAAGMPAQYPQPMAPNPFASAPHASIPTGAAPMPPAGMPGFFPPPGAMPNMPGGYPQPAMMPQPGFPPTGMPQMPQPMAPQPAAPQGATPPSGQSFLDDVLSGPSRSGSSSLDDLGFGDSSPATEQPSGSWPANQFPQPASNFPQPGAFFPQPAAIGGTPAAIEHEFAPAQQPEFDPSAAEPPLRPRAAARPKQNSPAMLIGGALGVVVLLAGGLIAAIVLKNREDRQVAIDEQPPTRDTGAGDSHQSSTGHSSSTNDPSKTKTPGGTHSGNPKPDNTHSGNSSNNKPPATPPTDPSSKPPKPAPADTPNVKSPDMKSPDTKSPTGSTKLVLQPTTPDPAAKPAKPKPPVVDPVKAARLSRLLADVRQKLAERNQDEASRLLADAKALAATPDQTERVDRLGTLVKYVGEFWGAVGDALGGLKATDEIDVGSTKVVVVESSKQSLTIHMGSGNKHFNLKELPSGLAVALANRWLDPNKPENKIFIGSFYAVDPKFAEADGPEQAKRLWSEAAAAGVSDGSYLLPVLNPEPAAPDMAGGQPDALPPIPGPDSIDRATRKVRDEFDEAILAATTPTKLTELIQRFFDAAESSDEPARRYALYVEARDTAAKAGRAKLAIDAIDHIAHEFQIDALEMKADTFSNNPPATPEAGREFANAALALVDEAVAAKRLAVASRLAQGAVAAAQASKGNALIKRATQKSKEIEALAGKNMAADAQ